MLNASYRASAGYENPLDGNKRHLSMMNTSQHSFYHGLWQRKILLSLSVRMYRYMYRCRDTMIVLNWADLIVNHHSAQHLPSRNGMEFILILSEALYYTIIIMRMCNKPLFDPASWALFSLRTYRTHIYTQSKILPVYLTW